MIEGCMCNVCRMEREKDAEIERLTLKNRELMMVLESVKHGAEYPDEVGDMIDAALSTGERADG